MRLRFGRFELVPGERRLLDGGRPVALGARAFDLLLALVERRDRLVGKAELLDLVWPGLVVEEANLPVQVSGLRKIIGPQGIATIPGRGYRFTMAVDDDAVAPSTAAAPAAAAVPQSNVPAAIEPLLGRQADTAALAGWLAEHRLVTVLGAGGIGKTRLAQAVARAAIGHFADGVWWVDAAALSTPQQLAPAIAGAAHLPLGNGDAVDLLARALARRETLLVLDNCEHLVAEVARIVRALLMAAPAVRVLTTSQEALKVDGEHLYLLSPLAVPPLGVSLATARGFAAVQLLEHRARAADPRFALTPATVDSAIELCRQLDGVALAIEMAAARLPTLGLAGLLARLGDRLSLLRAASREAPSRQRTLRATLDWSHGLLDTDERAVLRRLAVFAGSFRLDAAQQTAAFDGLDADTVLDALVGLVDKSLVGLDQLEPPRYRLAETTRLYAWEQLRGACEIELALRCHDQALAAVAAEAERCRLPEAELLQRYGPDYDDASDTFDRAAVHQDAETAAATVRLLWQLDQLRGVLSHTRRRVHAARQLLPLAGPWSRARLCSSIVAAGWVGGGDVARVDMAHESVRLWRTLGDAAELHHALSLLAHEAARAGRLDEAEAAAVEAGGIEDPAWPPGRRARRAFHAGQVADFRGDVARYRSSMAEALALFGDAGEPRFAALARLELATATLMEGDGAAAIAIGRQAVDELSQLDQPQYLGSALAVLCQFLLLADDVDAAAIAARQALALLDRADNFVILADQLALLAAMSGRGETAALLLGYADAWKAANQITRHADMLRVVDKAAARIDRELGADERHRLRAAGALLTDAQAIAIAQGWLAPGGAVTRP